MSSDKKIQQRLGEILVVVGLDEVRAEALELNRQARESDLPDQGEDVLL